MGVTPFVVGQWVRGERFYGRTALIEEILDGPRNWLWLLGTRRIGKTSVLKQVEHLTSGDPGRGYFPVFWDFQGADDIEELNAGFSDALLDAEPRLDAIGVPLDEVEAGNLFDSLNRLRRALSKKSLKALLLCDEVEELIKLNEREPTLLRKLRRALQSQEDVRSVMASTIRLWALSDERGDTSPFLHGFLPPLYIHNLTDDEARALIRQANLPGESRPRIDEQTVEIICRRCARHPYLTQLLCKRFLELEDIGEAVEQVAADPMVGFFFAVDFEMLSGVEHEILGVIAEQDSSTSNSIQHNLSLDTTELRGSLHRLEHLGYVHKGEQGRYVLANDFFRRWFRERHVGQATVESPLPGAANGQQSPELSLGEFDGRYQLLERVGTGATGMVFKASDSMLGAEIAIKILKPHYAANEEALQRLRREIMLSRDVSHPNVVNIYHLGEFGRWKYLTMQWVGGPTLAKTIAAEAPFDDSRTARIGSRLAAALEAAHDCQVLHRDIKPQNILMDERGEPHVTDFGLARLVDDTGMTRDGVFLGTPDYASPEQAALEEVDARSDLYSLGVILYEMATGRRPFRGSSTSEVLKMHRAVVPPDPRELRPGLAPALSGLILRCLEKDRERRIQSAGELRVALERASDPVVDPRGAGKGGGRVRAWIKRISRNRPVD